jgi:AraC family transcriptional regulator
MSGSGLTGRRFVANFRTDAAAPPLIAGLGSGGFAAARVVHSQPDHGISDIPAQDVFVFAFVMRDFVSSDLWVGGRPMTWDPVSAGGIHFYNLESGIQANIRDPLDFIYIYLPRGLMNDFSDGHDLPRMQGCSLGSGAGVTDPVIARLAISLLPALERPREVNQLFVDDAALALQVHFARRYGGIGKADAFFRGGLTPWQERRVKETMNEHGYGAPTVAQLAAECQLSRSQFFRAFRRSTGKTPHRWLLLNRLEKSKDLLLKSNLTIAEIARACGFVDQSHLTRAFSGNVGMSPGAWRRACRN